MTRFGINHRVITWLAGKQRGLIVLMLLVAAFTRLYRLPYTMQFLGDQGRDAILVSRIWHNFDLPFIGPVTSIGNVYTGPLYYYFMLPWLWLSYPSPVGPAYGVALLSILTVYLTYRWGKQLVGVWPAGLAAFLLTISSAAINFGRFSWNPNPTPLAALVFLYGLFRSQSDKRWWVIVALTLAVLLQLHYITMLCLPVAGLIWLYQAWQLRVKPKLKNDFIIWSVVGGLLFFLLLSPLFLFDIKHQGQNLTAFWQMIGPTQNISHSGTKSFGDKMVITFLETQARSVYLVVAPWWSTTTQIGLIIVLGFIGIMLWILKTSSKFRTGHAILFLTFVVSLLGLSFYGHEVYDHYVLFLLPVMTLLWGVVLNFVWRQRWWLKLVVALLIISAAGYNLIRWPIFQTTSPSLAVLQTTAQKIIEQVKPGEKYNIVLLSETKDYYGSNYRYFLTTYANKPPLIPERDDLNSAETLIIVDETKLTTDLNSIQQAEIRAFPNKNPESMVEVPGGPRLFVLRRTQRIDDSQYGYNEVNK